MVSSKASLPLPAEIDPIMGIVLENSLRILIPLALPSRFI